MVVHARGTGSAGLHRTTGLLLLNKGGNCTHVSDTELNFATYAYLVISPDLTDEVGERLIDIDALFSGGFNESAIEMFGEIAPL